jgi:hypothetical protein
MSSRRTTNEVNSGFLSAVTNAHAAAAKSIRRRTFNDVTELKTAIDDWIEHRNQNPKPFKWTASAKSILAKHRRAKKALAIAKAGCE